MSRTWTVACLAGDGVGPELMGEACRVLAEVARHHALRIDDVHLPFGGEAMSHFGHAWLIDGHSADHDHAVPAPRIVTARACPAPRADRVS